MALCHLVFVVVGGKFAFSKLMRDIPLISVFQTPLYTIASQGKVDMLEILLINGANVNEANVRISLLMKLKIK
jgi:hypothetical protein